MRKLMVLTLLLAVAACGDKNKNEPPDQAAIDSAVRAQPGNVASRPDSSAAAMPGDTVAIVTIKNDTLLLSGRRLNKGRVTFVFQNTDEQQHIIEIIWLPGARWRSLPAGKGGRVTFTADLNPGPYEIYCAVPTHKAKGERATFAVPQ
jgi:hypothetical protein